jgi:membrane-bound serine protease (ClpP class)
VVRMRRGYVRLAILTLILVGALLLAPSQLAPRDARAESAGKIAYSIKLDKPVLRDAQVDLEHGLADAQAKRAAVVIVRLDTPGGLVSNTREMSKAMIASPIPVIVFVYPEGARADSAGLFLTLSGDVAAMAPGTNIGSATPFSSVIPRNPDERALYRILERKARNDAIAWARGLAERHDRNADLAERMISKADNVPVTAAKRQGLIDVVAPTERSLLEKIDGFRVKGGKAQTLRTAGLPIRHAEIAAEPLDVGDSGDQSSITPVLLALLVPAAIALGIVTLTRGPGLWRRRRWIWRRWRAERRRRV